MTESRENERIAPEEKRKYLFLRQTEMLDGFLKNGAISRAQYDFSYNGLITKMNISDAEIAEWLSERRKTKESEK